MVALLFCAFLSLSPWTAYTQDLPKLVFVTTIQTKAEIARAALVSETYAVTTHGKSGTFTVVNLKDGSQRTFRSEAGVRARFEPTLISDLNGGVVIYDASEDIVHNFTLDGNSLRSVRIPREKLTSEEAKKSVLTALNYDGRTGSLLALTENGVLFAFGWDSALAWELPTQVTHTTNLRLALLADKPKAFVLAPLENLIVEISLTLPDKSNNSAEKPRVSAVHSLPSELLNSGGAQDFLPISSSSFLISYSAGIALVTDHKLSLPDLVNRFNPDEAVRFGESKSNLLMYSRRGKVVIFELK